VKGNQVEKWSIFMNFFINICPQCPLESMFWGEFGRGSRLFVQIVHALSRAIGPCRSLPSAAGRLIVLMSS